MTDTKSKGSRMVTDWIDWHKDYEDPTSALSQRRLSVQDLIRGALLEIPQSPISNVISVCAGDGGDILPVLAERGTPNNLKTLLLETDQNLVSRAISVSTENLLTERVTIRRADAGLTANYEGFIPAALIVAVGVFGNILYNEAEVTIKAFTNMLVPGGILIWSRGQNPVSGGAEGIRKLVGSAGFRELDYSSSQSWTIGMARLAPLPGRLFTFCK